MTSHILLKGENAEMLPQLIASLLRDQGRSHCVAAIVLGNEKLVITELDRDAAERMTGILWNLHVHLNSIPLEELMLRLPQGEAIAGGKEVYCSICFHGKKWECTAWDADSEDGSFYVKDEPVITSHERAHMAVYLMLNELERLGWNNTADSGAAPTTVPHSPGEGTHGAGSDNNK